MPAVLRCDEIKILEIFKEWVDLQSDINNDAVLWNKLRVQTKTALQTYTKKAKPKVHIFCEQCWISLRLFIKHPHKIFLFVYETKCYR